MQLEDLRVVIKVAEFRSITAAATHLDMQMATASAAVKRIEAMLGVELFVRTTRHLRLSSAGERYLPQCIAAMSMLDKAKQAIHNDLDIIKADAERSYKIKLKVYCAANDGDLVRRWCVAGKGVAVKSSLDIANDLLAGRLVPLIPDYKVPQGELWLICPSRQSITPTVRLLRDMFRERTKVMLTQLVDKGLLEKSVLEG